MMQKYLAVYALCLRLLLLTQHGAAKNYCGTNWKNADASCAIACPKGTDGECPIGQYCFADTCADGGDGGGGGGKNYNYCGTSWNNADSSCEVPCAGGTDDECPQGTTCFGDCTSCDPAPPPTPKKPTPAPAPIVPTTKAPFVMPPCDRKAKMSVNVGYYEGWAVWRDGCSIVTPEDIDIAGMGYTHLIYAFASISPSLTIEAWKGAANEEIPRMLRMNALKQKHPGLKTLLGVGGWSHNDPGVLCNRFSKASATATGRQNFANSVVTFLKKTKFDGIDFDWEYPADPKRCGVPADKENYALLVQTVREALDADNDGYLITMAVPASITRLDEGYNLPSLAQNLDWFNVMTYDIAGYWSDKVGSHTDIRHIREVIPYFFSEGVSSSSLVIGLGAYGRTFSLTDTSCTDIGCPFKGARGGGCPVWDEKGYTAYLTIQDTIESGDYVKNEFNSVTESMELVTSDYEFISYDSQETFSIKASYASEMCMRGYMWWAVDLIDESFTLEYGTPTVSPAPTITGRPTMQPVKSPPTKQPVAGPVCPTDHSGWLPYLFCTHYFYCQNGSVLGVPNACPTGTLYDVSIGNCNWIHNGVKCDETSAAPQSNTAAPQASTSDVPSILPTFAPQKAVSCFRGKASFEVRIQTDNFGKYISYQVREQKNGKWKKKVMKKNKLNKNDYTIDSECLKKNKCFRFEIKDRKKKGVSVYTLDWKGEELTSKTLQNKKKAYVIFGNCNQD